jgi:hypothetical protein
MADRAAIRIAVDLAFTATIIACAVTGYAMERAPAIPSGVCRSEHAGPRYDAMLADGTLTIAAVFGELAGGPADHNAWSYRAFAAALHERGFLEYGERFTRGDVTIDLALIANDPAQTTAALAGALASYDVIYYNGHSHDGDIELVPPPDYRVIVLDSCWSTQHFARDLVGANRDVLTNSERSITGSIESALVLIDALAARAEFPLHEMNSLAVGRARKRAPVSRFRDPERYRVDGRCE